jgi:hypothetical protein
MDFLGTTQNWFSTPVRFAILKIQLVECNQKLHVRLYYWDFNLISACERNWKELKFCIKLLLNLKCLGSSPFLLRITVICDMTPVFLWARIGIQNCKYTSIKVRTHRSTGHRVRTFKYIKKFSKYCKKWKHPLSQFYFFVIVYMKHWYTSSRNNHEYFMPICK